MSENRKESYQVYLDGPEFQEECLKLILSANEKITLHSYIFQLDDFGVKVREALIQKAKEGVAVEILLDFIGSSDLPKSTFDKIKNINFKYFNIFSFPKLIRVGRRLHYKILIVDTLTALVGGINIVDGCDPKHLKHPRLDFAIRVEGAIVNNLETYCSIIFSQLKEESPSISDFDLRDFKGSHIVFKVNDWFKERNQITSSYYSLIKSAKKEIILIHGYFFPSFKVLKLLKMKSRSGVSVVLVLPKYSDWKTWIWASDHLYRSLIKNKIKIMEWDLSVLHGKMAIFDERIATLGSHNLNYTSSYGNLEINVEVHDKKYVKSLRDGLVTKVLQDSREVTGLHLRKLPLTAKFRNLLFYSLLMFIAVFSVNYIKLSYQLAKMKPFQLGFLIVLVFIGVAGVFLPILPGLPFLLAAILFYIKIAKPTSTELRP